MARTAFAEDMLTIAPSAGLGHLTCGRLANQKSTFQIDTHNTVEVGLADLQEIRSLDDAGIVDQYIEPAEAVYRLVATSCGRRGAIADIGFDEQPPVPPASTTSSAAAASPPLDIHVSDDDSRAFPGEKFDASTTDATGPSRHDDCLVSKSHRILSYPCRPPGFSLVQTFASPSP